MENKKLLSKNSNVYDISLQGKRKGNEDRHFIKLNKEGKDKAISSIDMFAIFDGHGGKEISSYLVENLPWFFLHKSWTYPVTIGRTSKVCERIQQEIIKNIPESKNAGSTALMAMLYKNPNKNDNLYLNIINVGDCRCVLCKDNF